MTLLTYTLKDGEPLVAETEGHSEIKVGDTVKVGFLLEDANYLIVQDKHLNNRIVLIIAPYIRQYIIFLKF